jgi:metal-responsive CopG/Arc/MetJ family transcriptional regulator
MKESQKETDIKIVKTTINVPEPLWRDFSIEVIREHGGRMKNDVIIDLIHTYLDERKKEKK